MNDLSYLNAGWQQQQQKPSGNYLGSMLGSLGGIGGATGISAGQEIPLYDQKAVSKLLDVLSDKGSPSVFDGLLGKLKPAKAKPTYQPTHTDATHTSPSVKTTLVPTYEGRRFRSLEE